MSVLGATALIALELVCVLKVFGQDKVAVTTVVGVNHDFPAVIAGGHSTYTVAIPIVIIKAHHEIETVGSSAPTCDYAEGQITRVILLTQTEIASSKWESKGT